MKKNYEAMLGSLRRFCRSARVPEDRVVVIGSGILGALGLRDPRDLDVWVDPLTFELFAGLYNGVVQRADGAKVLESWAPFGQLEIWTGPMVMGGEDFSGRKETVTHGGFQHWHPAKAIRFKKARGEPKDLLDIKLLEQARCSCGSYEPAEVPDWGGWPACPDCGRV